MRVIADENVNALFISDLAVFFTKVMIASPM